MQIKEIKDNKKDFLDILLIGDESEKMIEKYLDKSSLYALYDRALTSVCAVCKADFETVEIKNLATYPKFQNKGYGTKLIEFVCGKYKGFYKYLILGTGENEKTLNFYKKRGFQEFKRIKNFFTDNYPVPIIENGRQLTDMIYLRKVLQ